jgi:hypothetical protein
MPEDLHIRAKSWHHEVALPSLRRRLQNRLLQHAVRLRQAHGQTAEVEPCRGVLADHCLASANDRENYKTVTDTDVVSLGWGKDREGKYDKISAFLVFYADWGSVNARVRALACP